jgi:cell wall-associated NlpC family hydrolase
MDVPPDLAVLAEMQEHARDEYPRECCGALTPTGYVPMTNKHPNPTRAFDCSDECNELMVKGDLLAVIHSHPNGPLGPSSWDMRQQIEMNVPWGLVTTDGQRVNRPFFWGDSLPVPPLEGRQFRHGPSGSDNKGDCYALIRDWWRLERQVALPEFPRDDAWWAGATGGDNLYLTGFGQAGFVDVGRNEGLRDPQEGDVMLMRIRAPVPNHGGVYAGNGHIIHHLGDCLSVRKPIGEWVKLVTHWLRRPA